MQDNDRKKVVNTEEQNEPVNPGDRIGEETVTAREEPANNKEEKDPGEIQRQKRESDVERPHHIEGDDAAGIDRKIPKL